MDCAGERGRAGSSRRVFGGFPKREKQKKTGVGIEAFPAGIDDRAKKGIKKSKKTMRVDLVIVILYKIKFKNVIWEKNLI